MQVALRQHDDEWLGLEQRLDRLEQGNLLVDGVPARFGDVEEEKDRSIQVSQRGDSLHLNRVALVKRVVKDAGRVDDLPASVLVLSVAHEQVLCRESVRLHIDVGIRDVVDEA